ncbi:hypothetical protein DMN91_008363 [Ooceraea biroi]|uniref:Reverse transcriptase domain-containing protein n=1 Tax=Ooceraea biroi TaxID=2015173 RepID=A0A3L8DH88_OOCBI|nr:hypothetical protein DMN91_008363 [Ooceraea biroi]
MSVGRVATRGLVPVGAFPPLHVRGSPRESGTAGTSVTLVNTPLKQPLPHRGASGGTDLGSGSSTTTSSRVKGTFSFGPSRRSGGLCSLTQESIFEKLISRRLEWWVENNHLLPVYQFGFRRGLSCVDNVATLVANIKLANANRLYSGVVFFDVAGAFDHVLPRVLIVVLRKMGVPEKVLCFLEFLLVFRKLHGYMGGTFMEARMAHLGLPQGMLRNVASLLQNALAKLNDLLRTLNLSIEPTKTSYCFFSLTSLTNIKRLIREERITISLRECRLRLQWTTQYFGIYIDYALSWSSHVRETTRRAGSRLNILKAMAGIRKEMDDVNINEISIHLDEIKLDADTDEWIKLSWTNRQNDTNEEAPEIPDTQKEDKTKDFVVTSDKKHINIATTVTDDESFAPILLITEKDGLKKKDSVKSNAPTNTIFDNNNANVEINNTIQKNTKRHVSQEEVISYRKPKSSFNTRDTQQNNQHYIGKNSRKKRFFEKILLQDHADWYFLRSNSRKTARKNMNTNYKLDWYFQRAHSRKNARKYIKYQQNTKFRRKHP